MKINLLLVLLMSVLLLSCQSVPKNITYIQDVDKSYQELTVAGDNKNYEPTLKASDVLLITVSAKETTDPQLVAAFNLPLSTFLSPGENTVQASSAIKTYIIDKNGYINYPVIGKVKLEGLPFSVAQDTLTDRIGQYIIDPIVNMELLSFKVTVLGEVNKPGPVPVTTNRVSIFDAIGAAGDMTIYGNRKNVKVYREYNDKKEVAVLDLTSSTIFASPYFYLQQNDVVMVDPNDSKKKESKYSAAELSSFSLIVSSVLAISTVVSVLYSTKVIK